MDAKRHDTKRLHSKPSSFSDTAAKEQGTTRFANLAPAHLGLAGPDWLQAAAPETTQPPETSCTPSLEPVSVPCALPPEPPNTGVSPHTRTLLEGMKVVCICKGIKKSAFWKALDMGSRTKDEINHLTGAGSGGCSGRRCGPRIMEMLRNLHGS